MKIALIGSRKAPYHWQSLANRYGSIFARRKYIARHGGAVGMDSAWTRFYPHELQERFDPWLIKGSWGYNVLKFDNYDQAYKIASKCFKNFNSLTTGAQRLHTRNVYQVLGKDLDDPVDAVVCMATVTDGTIDGGTRTACNIANSMGIPVFNIAIPSHYTAFMKFFKVPDLSNDLRWMME